MNNREVTEWRFHVGAHKTATTHLQRILQSRSEELLQKSVTYLPLSVARPLLKPHIAWPYTRFTYYLSCVFPRLRGLFIDARRRGHALGAQLKARQMTTGSLVVSEEDILGRALRWGMKGDTLYPHIHFVSYLEVLARKAPLHIFLTVRSLDGFLVSYYCETLKGHALKRSHLDAKIGEMISAPPRWLDLVRRISAAAPSARIEIWKYDEYAMKWPAMHESLCGCKLSEIADIGRPTLTRSPSERAVRLAEELAMESGPERARRVREIFREDIEGGTGEKFDPLDEPTRRILRERFERDLGEIERHFPDALRKFG